MSDYDMTPRSAELSLLLEIRQELRDWQARLDTDIRLMRAELQRVTQRLTAIENTCSERRSVCESRTPLPFVNEKW